MPRRSLQHVLGPNREANAKTHWNGINTGNKSTPMKIFHCGKNNPHKNGEEVHISVLEGLAAKTAATNA